METSSLVTSTFDSSKAPDRILPRLLEPGCPIKAVSRANTARQISFRLVRTIWNRMWRGIVHLLHAMAGLRYSILNQDDAELERHVTDLVRDTTEYKLAVFKHWSDSLIGIWKLGQCFWMI